VRKLTSTGSSQERYSISWRGSQSGCCTSYQFNFPGINVRSKSQTYIDCAPGIFILDIDYVALRFHICNRRVAFVSRFRTCPCL